MKPLIAVLLLATLGACSSGSAGPTASPADPPKTLPAAPPPPPMPEEGIVCPADVRLCPDGTYVSRDPDKACAFKPCPGNTQ